MGNNFKMRIWYSSNNRKEVENHRDKIKSDDECIYCVGKKEELIKGVKTRITKNKYGVFILWIGVNKNSR